MLNGLPALPVATARPVVLTAAERHRLKRAAYGHRAPHQDRLRVQIVLQTARGRGQRSNRPAKRERTWTPCPPGTAAVWVRDRLGELFTDRHFADWYPVDGHRGLWGRVNASEG